MPKRFDQKSIIDAFDQPVLLVGSGKVIAVNRAARALLGEGIVDRDVRVAFRQPQALAAILAGKANDLDITGIGGAERPWTLSIRPIGTANLLIRLHDRGEALTAEKMRVDFVANASHELRTPLATLSGYAETLAEADVPDELRQRFAATIGTEAARMLRLIEDLMSLSRIEGERFRLPDQILDLGEVARQAVQQIGPLAERRDCTVELAGSDEPLPVRGDGSQVLQAIDNLLSNAIRYGGCAKGPVTLSVGRENGRPVIRVSDKGRGIAPEHLPRLTERFYRVDEARSRGSGGTGLGLAIVKHIAERHRATLDVRSQLGKGTEVSLSFPDAGTHLS